MKRSAQTVHHARGWPITARIVVVATIICLAEAAIGQQPQAEILEPAPSSISDATALPTDKELAFVTVDPSFADLVAKLEDAVFDTREEAMQRLLGGTVDRRQICKMLARKDLTPEQRHRLLLVLRDDLLHGPPRGAIGISIDRRRRRVNEIIVEQLVEGLPAIEVLELGDRVTHLNGQPAAGWGSFVAMIQARNPGDAVTITVQRRVDQDDQGPQEPKMRTLQFELVLGSTELLIDPATGQVQRNTNLELARAKDADKAAVRFGPRPRLIEFRDSSTPEVESPTPQGG
ncbi:MAG: PDZ domain-containing protein [Planctomycetota bacterium]|nr:PDZ domain-containing protein [Planctomycetota bacterium]